MAKSNSKENNLLIIPAILSVICAYFLYVWGSSIGALIMLFVGIFVSPFNRFLNGQSKIAISGFLFLVSALVSAYQISNNGYQANQLADEIEEKIAPTESPVIRENKEPEKLIYTVEIETDRPPIKATYYIRIPKRYEAEQLRKIAAEVRSGIDREYENIFMFYILGDSSKEIGAYATSHYNPTLNVVLHDLSESQIKSASAKQDNKGAKIIGKFAQPYTKAIITIRKEKDGYIFNERYPDGSEGDTKMLHKTKDGQVIWSPTFSDGDGYYVIRNGDLVLVDEKNGLEVSVSKPIR